MARRSCACAGPASRLALRRVFVANRGEIAARILRTCRKLGIETVLATSVCDRDSLPARLADRSVCIGPSRPAESYLRMDAIVHAALATGADAIHPGYGFLSERAALASLCESEGIVFVGPTAVQLEAVGDKLRARQAAQSAAVPVVPGAAVVSAEAAVAEATALGLPLLVKAVGGGGGRGMKRVDRIEQLPEALALAAAEAGAAFGDPRLYLERCITSARHIEVQLLGDGAGRVVHLGERDCSTQRRYQKLIEETPAPGLAGTLRAALHAAAVRFAERLAYRGAGTVEFLVDREREAFYFLEMNARIQVEHPITEAVSGVDIVAEQLAIAGGAGLRLAQTDVRLQGCAIECRINAEDPDHDFRPSPGRVREAIWPSGEGIRVDTHVASGALIPPYYDSLMAKIIAHAADREGALALLRRALGATRLTGVHANLSFHERLLSDPEFLAGGFDTGLVSRVLERRAVPAPQVLHG